VCGHIHRPAVREIDGVTYCNDGDWVENCSALIEDMSGRLAVRSWSQIVQERRRDQLVEVAA
jgi:UDP-2,3-diacylglucosamine pyrophosphatase LpxH